MNPSRFAGDAPCTCGETERRKLAKEASGLSGRAFRKSERYEHGPHPAVPCQITRAPIFIEMHMPKGFTTVVLPDALVQDLVDARRACEECSDLNAGDLQRANLNEQRAMKAVCELVRKAYRP